MEFLQLLKDSQKSGTAAVLEFVHIYHNLEKVVACFVEGKDYHYYRSRVCENVNNNFEVLFFPCNGKREVEIAKKMIDDNLHLDDYIKVLFFCDKDYGIDEKQNGIFYTDYYSIENYYSNELFISNLLLSVFNINKYSSDYDTIIKLYREKYSQYYQQIIKVNAFCYGLRLLEKENNYSRTSLSDKIIKTICDNSSFTDFKMIDLKFTFIKKLFNSNTCISKSFYLDCLNSIDNTMLRGKWELEFTIWFLESLKKEIKKGGSGLSLNNNKIISFDNEIMTSMERYAFTSESLIYYIKSNT